MRMTVLFTALTLVLSSCATVDSQKAASLAPGAKYVSMGSSYAAGARIGPLVEGEPKRCGRTTNNYPRLLAAKLNLNLVDVSCGGAMSTHILGPWLELPPQIDAVTQDTGFVTITIGGNDLNYVRNLALGMCGRRQAAASSPRPCPVITWPSNADYKALEMRLVKIAQEIRRRAPSATIVFVDYLRILPDKGGCAGIPLDEQQNLAARDTFRRMAEATRKAASTAGAMLLAASQLSRGHDACSSEPWAAGHPGSPADWHPTAAGHAAIADALFARLR